MQGAAGARCRARQARGAGRGKSTAWAREALGVSARGARPGRACARRLGVLAGQLGQVCALCTWPSFDSVFGPVRLSIFS